MNKIYPIGVLISLALGARGLPAQPLAGSGGRFDKERQEAEAKSKKEIGILLDAKARTREIESERGYDGNLNILKACADVGIICGLELNSKMLGLLNGFTRKRYTLHSLFHGVLGKEARVMWVPQKYVSNPGASLYVLTVKPKRPSTRLDQVIPWNVSLYGPAKWDMHQLSRTIGFSAKQPALLPSLSISSDGEIVHMPARDVLNHIAAMNNISWLVTYSSTNKNGMLTIFPDKE